MIAVHASWESTAGAPAGVLRLWAEDDTSPLLAPRRPGRRPRVVDHPFAAPAAVVGEALGVAGAHEHAELLLPTAGRDVVPSPRLGVVGPQAPLSQPRAWRVPVVDLDPDAAWVCLRPGGRLSDDPTEEPDADGVVVGDDLRPWQALALLAGDLARRGRVLPSVVQAGDATGAALWRAVVTGEDAEWLAGLAAGLPTVPVAVLAGACDALVDAAVRAALPQPQSRRGRRTWRRALSGTDRSFTATPAEVRSLRHELGVWQREAVGTRALRGVFRLVEPPEPELAADDQPADDPTAEQPRAEQPPAEPASADWRLEFAVQPADQPSVLVDAAQLWRGRPAALAGYDGDPREALLTELGRALRLYPALERALHTARPDHLAMPTGQAHEFLTETAALLLGAGFGVVLPGWWGKPAARLGARLQASTPAQPGAVAREASIGLEGLVDVRWELALGDEQLTEEDVERLLTSGESLVRLRGQWVQVDVERLRRARAHLARRQRGRDRAGLGLAEVLRAGAGLEEGPGDLPVVGVEADGWLRDLLSGADRRVAPVSAPPGFEGQLRPYQERGLAWLAFHEAVGTGAVLADDMGLGKTVQLLALIARDDDAAGHVVGERAGPTLLVCPTSLVGTWQREAAKFTPSLRVHVHHGSERPRGEEFTRAVQTSDLVVTTYALLARDAAALREVRWLRLVLDEAQAVKNAATKAAVAARSVPAPRRIAVTGTPVENRLADLWSLMTFANPGLLGTATQFKDTFATPVERHGDEDAAARLRALTSPFVLRRVKTDTSVIADLPAKLEMDVVCPLTREQAKLYAEVVDDMLTRMETSSGMERRGLVLATMTKLKQVCNHPAQFLGDGSRVAGRSGKLDRLEGILEEVLAAGERALLFTQYAEFGHMLRAHLAARTGREVAFLHGGVSRAERDRMVARFQDGSGPPLFVLSLKAGGTGLTLTAANHVVHVDRWWNPAVEDQATDRAYRIGQTKPVQVRKLVCAGTLEEKIGAMIAAKRGLAASIVGSGEAWLTELSTEQLRELVTLDPQEREDAA